MHEVVPRVVAIAVSIVIAAITNMGTVSAYNSGHGGHLQGISPCLSGKWIYLALFAGIAFGLNNKMTLYLCGIMDSAVFFPVYNVGALLLNTFSGIVIFREKLSKRQIVGIAIGIVSVLCLCNPFA